MIFQAKRERIHAMMARLRQELLDLQVDCPHENKAGEYKGDTGNWCPADDSYWIDGVCLDCGKRFHIDSRQDPKGYSTFFDKAIKVVIK